MMLKNKTNKFLVVDGKRVRPYRSVSVSDEIEYDKNSFEIVGEITNKIIKVKKHGSR